MTVLITGANRGIGREVARQLAARDCDVIIGARDAEAGREAAAAISAKTTFLQIDVLKDASVATAARTLQSSGRTIDVLINNAGILDPKDANILVVSEEAVRRTLETNSLGALRVTREFMPLLARSATPRIINVSSEAGQLIEGTKRQFAAYCLSKAMLNAMTMQLAAALPRFAVNAVRPGWVRTRLGTERAPDSVEKGADTIVWLTLDAPQTLTGKFLHERKEIPWAISC